MLMGHAVTNLMSFVTIVYLANMTKLIFANNLCLQVFPFLLSVVFILFEFPFDPFEQTSAPLD